MIKPAKAITPSITKTLNRAKTNMSDNKIVDKKQDTRKIMLCHTGQSEK